MHDLLLHGRQPRLLPFVLSSICVVFPGYNEQLRISVAVLDRLPFLPSVSGNDVSSSSSSTTGAGETTAAAGSSVLELSDQALMYLSHVFDIYDSSRSGVLSATDLEHMFNRAPVPIYQVSRGRQAQLASWGGGRHVDWPAARAALYTSCCTAHMTVPQRACSMALSAWMRMLCWGFVPNGCVRVWLLLLLLLVLLLLLLLLPGGALEPSSGVWCCWCEWSDQGGLLDPLEGAGTGGPSDDL
jgi:hypothetical protein